MATATTLPSGQEVHTDSEEWRAWCEAKHVCKLPDRDSRQRYINTIRRVRGDRAADDLQENVRVAWNLQKS